MTSASIKKILLVDDNPLFLKMLSRAFERSGLECINAGSGQQALTILSNIMPDAILSDYDMPGMDGMQFREKVMTDANLAHIPFIFLTGNTDNELMIKGLDMQAVDYVFKDTPVNIIISKLNNLLYTVQKQQELSSNELKKAAEALNVRSIPAHIPIIEGFTIDFWHQPYQNIPGGDFIDFIQADERRTFIVMGDIMGKKWMAWFFTFSYLSYIRAAIRFCIMNHEYAVAGIMQKVNTIICLDDVLKDILSSLSLLMIDKHTGLVTYSGAGDLPLLCYTAATGQLEQISGDGLLLGLFADGIYNEQQISLSEGDQLFIFTDGMIDYSAGQGKKSDYQNFASNMRSLLSGKATFQQIKQTLFEPLLTTQVDDCSIINLYKTS